MQIHATEHGLTLKLGCQVKRIMKGHILYNLLDVCKMSKKVQFLENEGRFLVGKD